MSTAVQPADHAVTVLVSRQVRPGCGQQFEAVAQQLLHVATQRARRAIWAHS